MNAHVKIFMAVTLGFQVMNAATVLADEKGVPERIKQEVIDAEKQPPEQEKTEEGEASGNVVDCEQSNEAGSQQGGVDKKDLDECEEMVK